jgi:hypothetical protein
MMWAAKATTPAVTTKVAKYGSRKTVVTLSPEQFVAPMYGRTLSPSIRRKRAHKMDATRKAAPPSHHPTVTGWLSILDHDSRPGSPPSTTTPR